MWKLECVLALGCTVLLAMVILNVNFCDFIVLIATVQFNYYPPQLWYVDGADDDDFEETMNKVDGDVQTEQASTDFDFEDDN
jgi:hypothetical protein